ncbi:Required for meiotic nuclear division protein 1 [Purpureocillium lavendulum]|uniref:Required for meiotic nuclear division protein 1 n=1 Tax=Purpureocillium lavendulum TaxID=1247861 RepID=A0AB34FLF3_9HYPO|nr:Required for meiotic nuclear division protein 1 [Purpureocillium lavendulum]
MLTEDFCVQSREPIAVDAKLLETAKQGLPPRGVTDFLVHVFFHTVEANYYYMDRQEFMARLSNWYENPANDNLDPSFLCLLLIVLAMGSQFAELEGSSPRVRTKSVSRNGHGMVFYLKAKSLLSDVVTQCSLESIQACFLMGLFLLPTNISDLSYVYHGMALKMAISAGLHRQIKETNLDQRVMHVRNRLWWSLYTSERRLTIFLDRPQSIHEEDIDTPLPEFSQELDLPQSENNVANLQASISLTRIFNQVVRVGRTVGFGNDIGENTITTIRRTLDDWVERLPQQLKLESLSPDMKSFRGAVHLHMNWNQIVIFMGRKSLLRQFRRCLSRRHDISQAESSPLPALNDEGPITALEARLIQDCVSAAVKIIHLIDYLWKMGKLARFSFTDYNCCSMATLIIMVHEIAVQQPLYPLYLETAMQAMTHMATGCHNAGQALKLIQHLQRVFAGLKNKEPQERRSNHVGDNVSAFREWERELWQWTKMESRLAGVNHRTIARRHQGSMSRAILKTEVLCLAEISMILSATLKSTTFSMASGRTA